uniref:Uncharacterized protein n=1 Tax=viral metagenome TaxID=1070528 RepID=A0A6C0KVX7_9ZZZZ
MSNSKTIKINTEYFNNIGSKTKKNREKKERSLMQKPIINPNSLKKQLLNRIKEHKNKEKIDKESKIASSKDLETKSNIDSSNSESSTLDITDEFYDSINYLNSLSKKHKEDGDKKKYEKAIEKKRQDISNRTLKNYNSVYSGTNSPYVETELPEELKETFISREIIPIESKSEIETNPRIKLNYKIDDTVAYGCLKGGIKPTYKALHNKTRRNYNEQQVIQQVSQPTSLSEREKRLEILKQRLKKHEEYIETQKPPIYSKIEEAIPIAIPTPVKTEESSNNPIIGPIFDNRMNILERNQQTDEICNPEPAKKFIKRTIKRKYTLGKSKIYKKVGVLIKDRNTRKTVVNAHKELKKKPINEVKNYLKKHGLIKVGSNAPNDILRKTYESAILAGDVVNNNKDTLIHNFLNDTENE